MEEEVKQRFCPLFPGNILCGEYCAWYCDESKRCAMCQIASDLNYIGEMVLGIKNTPLQYTLSFE